MGRSVLSKIGTFDACPRCSPKIVRNVQFLKQKRNGNAHWIGDGHTAVVAPGMPGKGGVTYVGAWYSIPGYIPAAGISGKEGG